MHKSNEVNLKFKLSKLLPWLMCGLASLFYCYEYLLRIAPSVMVSDLMGTFSVSATSVGLLSTFYFWSYTPMQLPVGIMMDRYGPRRILTVAILCCGLGSWLMSSSSYFQLLLIGRLLIGFGSAFAFVGVLKLATIWLPPNKFALIAGLTTSLGMIGAMFGQNLLKRMVIDLSWDYTLYYAGIAGFILAPAIWFLVRDKPADNDTTPPRQMPQSYFSYQQLFQDIIKVMRTPQIWINGLIGGLIILPTTIFAELWGAPFLEQYYALDSATAVKATSMIFLGWAMGGPLAGLISDRTQRRRLPLMLGSITGMMVLLVVIYYPPLPTVVLFSLLVLFGILSSVEIIVFAVARENSPDGVTGTAIALTNFMVVCAGFMQWLVGKMLDRLWDGTLINGYPYYSAKGYHLALMILPISMLVAFILCFALKEKRDEAGLMQAQESPK